MLLRVLLVHTGFAPVFYNQGTETLKPTRHVHTTKLRHDLSYKWHFGPGATRFYYGIKSLLKGEICEHSLFLCAL